MRQVADCVPYQGKNTYFCPGMAQVVSTSIIYNRRFRPFSNDIVKQPTATTWILGAYISFCGTNCATLGSKHPFSPWCGTQSRTRPLQNHARPSANPSRAHDHVRTAPGTGQSQQDGATTTSTDARRRPTRPTSWSYGRTNTRCSRRPLRPEMPLMNPPNLTSPLPGLASPAGPAGNERITTTCLVSDCTAISQLWQTRTRSRYAGKARCVFSPQRVAQRNIPAPGCGEHAKYAGTV